MDIPTKFLLTPFKGKNMVTHNQYTFFSNKEHLKRQRRRKYFKIGLLVVLILIAIIVYGLLFYMG